MDVMPKQSSPIRSVLLFFLVCMLLRFVEYLFLRTDQTIVGEAFVHKLMGILLLFGALRLWKISLVDIGLQGRNLFSNALLGLGLGILTFIIAYSVECAVLHFSGKQPTLRFYVTAYSLQGNQGTQTGALFILLCIALNLVNVLMEEGVFRGLFLRRLWGTYTFGEANLLAALLFGIWHIAMPLRSYIDGNMGLSGMLLSGLGYLFLTFLMGIKWGLFTRATGSLWAAMGEHFINNTVVNLLHVTSAAGVDNMQFIRISVAQTLSFLAVLIYYNRYKAKQGIFYQF